MKASKIARGGMLTGLSVLMLYLACVVPPCRWAFCAVAGVLVALPLSVGWVKIGALVYAATGVLSLLLIPDKRYAVIYLMIAGLYPMVKYGTERLHCLPLEIILKALFASIIGGISVLLMVYGFLPGLEEWLEDLNTWWVLLPFYLGFTVVDVALSRIIALLHALFVKK